jgi:exonuclease VII large subunit
LAAAPSRAQRAVASAAREERHRLDLAAARVAAVDPARILALGFAIVRHPGRGVVTGIAGLAPGEALRIELREGAAHVTVDHLEPDPKERP